MTVYGTLESAAVDLAYGTAVLCDGGVAGYETHLAATEYLEDVSAAGNIDRYVTLNGCRATVTATEYTQRRGEHIVPDIGKDSQLLCRES